MIQKDDGFRLNEISQVVLTVWVWRNGGSLPQPKDSASYYKSPPPFKNSGSPAFRGKLALECPGGEPE